MCGMQAVVVTESSPPPPPPSGADYQERLKAWFDSVIDKGELTPQEVCLCNTWTSCSQSELRNPRGSFAPVAMYLTLPLTGAW